MVDHHQIESGRLLRSRHVALSAALALILPVAVSIAGPATTATARTAPVQTTEVRVTPQPAALRDLGGQLPPTARAGAITATQRVKRGLAVAGVTWEPGALQEGDRLELRSRDRGPWQPWREMEVDDEDHAPDPGTAEAASSRPGTLPSVVEGDEMQVRVVTDRAVAPEVEVTFVDPGTSDADDEVGMPSAGRAAASVARPTIYTRADWGADETLRENAPDYGQVQVGFVHHTVGSNTYSADQVPGILRGIYTFHVNGRGWNDVGYQFLVDRFGRVWEGRAGGVDKAVVGAQAGGFNSGSFGASVLGDFTSVAVPSAVSTALAKLFAWKFDLHGIPATGRVDVSDVSFNRISGHRDANATSCPGARLYETLPALRSSVAGRLGTQAPSVLRRSVDAGGTPDLLSQGPPADSGAPGDLTVLRSAGPQPLRAGVRIGTGWNALRHIVLSPDLTGDGNADIVAVSPASTGVRVYAGNGRGGFAGVTERGSGWQVMTRLVATGDRTGDGQADLLAVRTDGALVLYEGDGAGWLRTRRVVGTGFDAYRSVTDAGDVDGDGRRDLITVGATTNVMELWPGSAGGGLGAPVRRPGGWAGLDQVSAADIDGDGRRGDLLVRQADGRMRSYYADETGRLTRMNTFGRGWGGLDNLTTGPDWNGDAVPDLVARVVSSGDLRLYAGTGLRDFTLEPFTVDTGVADANLVRVVGDVDGDGLADAVARTPAGDLIGLRGRGDGSFARLADRIGRGWQVFDLIEPVGDYTHDGVPDLIARTPEGDLRIYAMTPAFGFAWWLPIGRDWGDARSITATGAVNGDANADVVVLRSDGTVRLYRGTGPGALNHYRVVLTGQTDLARIVGTGDLTGDGRGDLVGQSSDGTVYLYPGDGKGGFRASREPLRTPEEVGDVTS